jgi:hypothetical protein
MSKFRRGKRAVLRATQFRNEAGNAVFRMGKPGMRRAGWKMHPARLAVRLAASKPAERLVLINHRGSDTATAKIMHERPY